MPRVEQSDEGDEIEEQVAEDQGQRHRQCRAPGTLGALLRWCVTALAVLALAEWHEAAPAAAEGAAPAREGVHAKRRESEEAAQGPRRSQESANFQFRSSKGEHMHGNHTEMTRLCSALTGAARRAFRPTPTRSSHFCRGGVQPLGWRRALSTAHDAGGSAGGSTGGSTGGGVSATVPLHWGEMDAFAHMNNVSYFRHFETARIVHFEAMVREGERRRRYQRTLSLSTQPYTVYSTGYHGTEPYMYRDDARQSQWRVVERQDARGSEDRGQKTGGEDPAILPPSSPPSFTLAYGLHSPTPNLQYYYSNHTHRTHCNPTVPALLLNKPPP